MENDILYKCAKSFENLTHYQYELQLLINKSIKNVTLSFAPNEFKHLSALEKLKDKAIFKELTSYELLTEILQQRITLADVEDSNYKSMPINDVSINNIEYYVIDRITELENLHNNLHNMTISNMKIFKWNKDTLPYFRPNRSEINADILIEFQNPVTQKINSETACAFFIETNENNAAVGTSIFPTDISYSNHGKISLDRYQILSVKEINLDTGKTTDIIRMPDEFLEKCQQDSINNSQRYTIKNDLKTLKSKRSTYNQSPSPTTEKAYRKRMDIFANRNIYTAEMLCDVAERLNAQLQDPHNAEVTHLIAEEIKSIQAELSSREQNNENSLPTKSFSIVQNTQNSDGTLSMKPIVTVDIPQPLVRTKAKVDRNTHLIGSSLSSVFSDIGDFLKKTANTVKSVISPPPKSKKKAKQPVQKQQSQSSPVKNTPPPKKPTAPITKPKENARFSVSDLHSEKYAPRSQKNDRELVTHKNDLDR